MSVAPSSLSIAQARYPSWQLSRKEPLSMLIGSLLSIAQARYPSWQLHVSHLCTPYFWWLSIAQARYPSWQLHNPRMLQAALMISFQSLRRDTPHGNLLSPDSSVSCLVFQSLRRDTPHGNMGTPRVTCPTMTTFNRSGAIPLMATL